MVTKAVSIEEILKKAREIRIPKPVIVKALRLAIKYRLLVEVEKGMYAPTEKGMGIYNKFHTKLKFW